jgi:hypothetical protein
MTSSSMGVSWLLIGVVVFGLILFPLLFWKRK